MASQQLSTNTFGCARWIVSSDATQGSHTTIAAALTSASSGDTIFIRPGTYTENLTLKAGVNICSYVGEPDTPNVTIIGKMTYTGTGVLTISGVRLQTNSDFFLVVSGSSASGVTFKQCYFNCSNNTGISFTSSNAAAVINCEWCSGDVGTTGIALFASSSAGVIGLNNVYVTNSGGSSTANTISAGTVSVAYSSLNNAITSSGTASVAIVQSKISTSTQNVTALTVGGSGGNTSDFSLFSSGTASAISISQALTLSNATVNSSNANSITGGGTLNYTPIAFSGSSSTVNTSTQVPLNFGPKIYATGGISFDSGTTTLSTYTEGTFTPTMVGAGAAGVTTYSSQNGYYIRVGNVVTVQFTVIGTGATGTGNIVFGGLPFTIKNQTNGAPTGAILSASAAGFIFVVGTSMMTLLGTPNSTTCSIWCSGTATSGGAMQMANAAFNFQGTMTYEI